MYPTMVLEAKPELQNENRQASGLKSEELYSDLPLTCSEHVI
jgi:hypothetical protein